MACLTLFTGHNSIPCRVGIGMMLLITTFTLFDTAMQETPKVSYLSYLDIWMVVAVIFNVIIINL